MSRGGTDEPERAKLRDGEARAMSPQMLADDPHHQRHGIEEVAGAGVVRDQPDISCTQQRLHGTTVFRACAKVKSQSANFPPPPLASVQTRTPAPEPMLRAGVIDWKDSGFSKRAELRAGCVRVGSLLDRWTS